MKMEMSAAEYRAAMAGMMTEAEWRKVVLERAEQGGWEIVLAIPDDVYLAAADVLAPYNPALKRRVPRSPRAAKALSDIASFPDLFLANRKRNENLFVELKTQKGKPTTGQREKIDLMTAGGLRGGILRPRDLVTLDRVLGLDDE